MAQLDSAQSPVTVQEEIDRATEFGQRLEELVVNRGSVTLGLAGDRDRLLLAYWSLAFDYNKSILALLRNRFYGGAFALLRPLVEAQIRAHVALMGSDDDVAKIKGDTYFTNFKTIGAEIDTKFGLHGFYDRFLNGNRGALHSFTHSGLSQLGRRFNGNDLEAHYVDVEIIQLIRTASNAVYMVTILVTKHFKLGNESKTADDLFAQWARC